MRQKNHQNFNKNKIKYIFVWLAQVVELVDTPA